MDANDSDEIYWENEECIPGPQDMWDEFDSQEVENRASMLVCGLLASSSVVHSTAVQVVEQTSSLVDDISLFMKSRVLSFALG